MSDTYSIGTNIFEQRKSVRKYQTGHLISRELLNELFRLAALAPSAWNLQHWKFIVIEDARRKAKLYEIAYKQQQILDASAIVIVLGNMEAHLDAEQILARSAELGYMPANVKESYMSAITHSYSAIPMFARDEAVRNASLASMQLMLAAKALGIDSGPMIGFNQQRLVEELQIPEKYLPVMMITLGFSAASPHATYRLPVDEFVVYESFAEGLQEEAMK